MQTRFFEGKLKSSKCKSLPVFSKSFKLHADFEFQNAACRISKCLKKSELIQSDEGMYFCSFAVVLKLTACVKKKKKTSELISSWMIVNPQIPYTLGDYNDQS